MPRTLPGRAAADLRAAFAQAVFSPAFCVGQHNHVDDRLGGLRNGGTGLGYTYGDADERRSSVRVVSRSAAKAKDVAFGRCGACMAVCWLGGERAGRRIAARFGRVCEAVPPPVLCLASCLDHACSLPTGR